MVFQIEKIKIHKQYEEFLKFLKIFRKFFFIVWVFSL